MAEDRKRFAVIGISFVVLLAIGALLTLGVVYNNKPGDVETRSVTSDAMSTMKTVEAICSPTDYKTTCVNSLKGVNTTDPKELIKAGFAAGVKSIGASLKKSDALRVIEKDPRAAQALENCKELMGYSIDNLRRSLENAGHFDLNGIDEVLSNLKTWLSAALTYQETCFDGFENTTGDAGKKMRQALKTATQITSNGLAMITDFHDTLESMNMLSTGVRREMLSSDDRVPDWVPEEVVIRGLVERPAAKIKADLVVAKDGSGKYKTIKEALKDIPKKSNKTFVLYIKEGVYREQVQFNKSLTHLMVIGDGPTNTRITFNKNYVDGTPTFETATVEHHTPARGGFRPREIHQWEHMDPSGQSAIHCWIVPCSQLKVAHASARRSSHIHIGNLFRDRSMAVTSSASSSSSYDSSSSDSSDSSSTRRRRRRQSHRGRRDRDRDDALKVRKKDRSIGKRRRRHRRRRSSSDSHSSDYSSDTSESGHEVRETKRRKHDRSKKRKEKDRSKSRYNKHDKRKFKENQKDEGSSGPVQLSKFLGRDYDDGDRRSAVSGKKILLKVEKTKEDKLEESKRSELLKFLNASFD
ncbi:hypothetical protein SAY86_000395 [Trapa natans]|uniref:Pectinesterase inhibitor domain-containing protein n=1 Tax=Trapa natans TaxID=22666 RepID=A0AAN7MNF2_TRANT|nr:hypothetical protein SAY86_000395 [Trapa natans]